MIYTRRIKITVYLLCFGIVAIGHAQKPSFSLPQKDLFVEGITKDPATGIFYLSSIFHNKIVSFSKGKVTDLISDNENGFMGGVGLHVDVKRRILWACSGNIMGPLCRTGIFAYDLNTKKLLKKIIFPLDTIPTLFNDLAIASDGSVYITNTLDHSIWHWSLEKERPIRLNLSDSVKYPNGIEISPDNKYLFVAASDALKRIEISTGKVIELQSPGVETSGGMDGIAFYKNSIIGVQDKTGDIEKVRIVRFYLSEQMDAIIKEKEIDRKNKYFDSPTTLTIAGNRLYVVANSQLPNLDQAQLKILDPNKLTDTYILGYTLE